MTEFKYRLLGKTSWGIAIDIIGYVSKLNNDKSKFDKVTDKIWIDFTKVLYLNIERKQLIINGLKWVDSNISCDEDIVITINEITVNPTDFQDEGLFFAMAGWASQHFNFELPEYDFSFNKEMNRYVFPLLS